MVDQDLQKTDVQLVQSLKIRATIQTILSTICVVGIAVLLFVIFRKTTNSDLDNLYRQQLLQKDSVSQIYLAQIKNLQQEKHTSDSVAAVMANSISGLQSEIISLQKNTQDILRNINEKIPAAVNSYSDDQLKGAFADPSW